MIAAALALYYAAIPIFGANFAKVCSKGKYGPPDHCAYYDIVSAFVGRAFIFADDHSGIITALAGVAVAAFTGVLWVATHKLWLASERQIRLARDEFEAEHRPWIAIRGAKPTGPVQFLGDRITVEVEFTIENTGRSPAVGFYLVGGMILVHRQAELGDLMGGLIRTFDEAGINFPSEVIFPQEVATHRSEFRMSMEDARDVKSEPVMFLLILYGSFCYRAPVWTTPRHTNFVYSVGTKATLIKLGKDGYWPPIPVADDDIRKWPVGWHAT